MQLFALTDRAYHSGYTINCIIASRILYTEREQEKIQLVIKHLSKAARKQQFIISTSDDNKIIFVSATIHEETTSSKI